MAKKFQIDKQYLLHEGGTKFYQAFLVQGTTPGGQTRPPPVTVTHWGKQLGAAGPRRVVTGGQHKVQAGNVYQEKIAEKRGRGYQDSQIAWGTTAAFDKFEDFRKELDAEFGRAAADEIVIALGLTVDGHDPANAAPIQGPQSTTSAPEFSPECEGEEWGEW